MAELHGVAGTTLGHRPEVGGIPEHLGERDRAADDLRRPAGVHALDQPAPAVEVTDDVTHELLGHRHLDPHHRLENDRAGLGDRVLDRHGTGDLERHLRRVDLVVRPVDQRHPDIDHRHAGVDARVERLADAHVDRLDVLAGDRGAHDLVHELVATTLRQGLDLDDGVAVLALAAGLADEAPVALGGPADRLAVGDLRLADVRRHLELAHHAVHEDVEVQLAHAGDQRLARLLVRLDAEGGVLLGQALERDAQLVLVGLGLGLDRNLDHRLGERHRLQDHGVIRVRQRVAREGLLEADGGRDVARVHDVDLFAVVRVHLEDAADPLPLALRGVEHVGPGLERPRVDPEEGQLADERVRGDLERERAERLGVVRGLEDLLVGARAQADDRRHVQRRREVVDDRVEHGLDALVLEGGAVEDRHPLVLQGGQPDAALDLRLGQLLALEVLVGEPVVDLRHRLEQALAMGGGLVGQLGRDGGLVERVAEVVPPDQRLHPDEVHHALVRVLDPDRDLDRHRGDAQAVADHVHVAPEVGARPVELVDEADPGHAVPVCLAPDRLGLGLDTRHAVEHDHRAIEDAQAPLDFHREVHVPGRIDNVDAVIVPRAGRGSRGDRDPALLLLGHPVHGGRALMDLTELVDLLRVEEDPLCDGRLARVDMRDDPDVPRSCERNGSCHGWY